MNGSTLCFFQVTLVLAVALSLSNLLLRRAPALATKLGGAGMFASAALVLIILAGIPRPFSASAIFGSQASLVAMNADETQPVEVAPKSMGSSQLGLRVGWSALVEAFGQSSSSEPVVSFDRTVRTTLWCVGVCIALAMVCRIVVGTCAVVLAGRGSTRLNNQRLNETISEWRSQLQLSTPVEIHVCPAVPSPCVTWLHRGVILVPEDFPEWSENDQRTALAHEIQHVLRRDALFRLFVDVMRIAVCLHPLSYYLRKQIVLAQELATDHGAMALMGNQFDYQAGLASLALRIDSRAAPSELVFGVSASTNDLVRRIKMLSSVSSPLPMWKKALAVFVMAVATGSVAMISAADEPPKVAPLPKADPPPGEQGFQQPATRPWESIGPSDSYLRVDFTEFRENESLRKALETVEGSCMKDDDGLGRGLLADSMQVFESDLHMEAKKLQQATKDGKEWAIYSAVDKLHVRFNEPIEWASVASAFNWDCLGPPESEVTKRARASISALSKSNVLHLALASTAPTPVNSELAKRLWQRIDGGSVGVVWRVHESLQQDAAAEADESGLIKLLQSCQAVALGLDFDAGVRTVRAKLVIAVNEEQDIDKVLKQVEDMRGFYLKTIANKPGANNADRQFLRDANIEVQSLGEDKRQVIVITYLGNFKDFIGL